jgi:hypothetical protein
MVLGFVENGPGVAEIGFGAVEPGLGYCLVQRGVVSIMQFDGIHKLLACEKNPAFYGANRQVHLFGYFFIFKTFKEQLERLAVDKIKAAHDIVELQHGHV